MLVLGAGCSVESPTNLRTARDLAVHCHRQLVLNDVLGEGDVEDASDLSSVADAVFSRRGSHRDLVMQFPPDAFRYAQPNDGYCIMGALLLEGALADVVTLNFDRTASTALAGLGAGADVCTLRGPNDHQLLGQRNLIYVHGDIDSDPDDIILRSAQLDDWKGRWREVIAARVLASPVVVFVGIGTAASLLAETTRKIHSALSSGAQAYIVDPLAYEASTLAEELGVQHENYLRVTWGDFMDALSDRVVEEQREATKEACAAVMREPGSQQEDVEELCGRLAALGLVALGQLRAAWMMSDRSYLAQQQMGSLHYFANLLVGIGMLERMSGHVAEFGPDGLVEFVADGGYATRAMVCFGGGVQNRASLEAKLSMRREAMRRRSRDVSVGLVTAVEPSGQGIATPPDIAVGSDQRDLVLGPSSFAVFSFEEFRADESLVQRVLG